MIPAGSRVQSARKLTSRVSRPAGRWTEGASAVNRLPGCFEQLKFQRFQQSISGINSPLTFTSHSCADWMQLYQWADRNRRTACRPTTDARFTQSLIVELTCSWSRYHPDQCLLALPTSWKEPRGLHPLSNRKKRLLRDNQSKEKTKKKQGGSQGRDPELLSIN